ncbi:hypothetical protein ACFQX6_37875 [Streptosporangium lutulentum]
MPSLAAETPPGLRALQNLVSQLWLPEGEVTSWPVRVTSGEVPPGFRAVETYAVVPSPERARFLVPLATAAAAAASVGRYNGLREPGTRVFRFLLGLGYRLRIAQRVIRHRLVVCVDERLDERALPGHLLSAHLREVLGEADVVVGAGVHRIDPHHKPVLQLFSPAGKPVGYVKVGWNDATRTMVATEAEALSLVGDMNEMHVPRVLHEGTWRDYRLTVTAPLPETVRRHREPDRLPAARFSLAVAESTGGYVAPCGRRGSGAGSVRRSRSSRPRKPSSRRPWAGSSTGSSSPAATSPCGSVAGTVTGCRGTSPGRTGPCACGTGSTAGATPRSDSTRCTGASRSPWSCGTSACAVRSPR